MRLKCPSLALQACEPGSRPVGSGFGPGASSRSAPDTETPLPIIRIRQSRSEFAKTLQRPPVFHIEKSIMRPLNYQQRLFVEHYLGESSGRPSMPRKPVSMAWNLRAATGQESGVRQPSMPAWQQAAIAANEFWPALPTSRPPTCWISSRSTTRAVGRWT